jgi:hypothetical protein
VVWGDKKKEMDEWMERQMRERKKNNEEIKKQNERKYLGLKEKRLFEGKKYI